MASDVLLQQLKSYLAKQQKNSLIAAIVLCVIFIGFIILAGLYIPAKGNDIYYKYGILAFFAVVTVLVIATVARGYKFYDPETSKLLDIVKIQNSDGYFVWVYILKYVKNGIPSWHLVFRSIDNKKYEMTLPDESHTKFINMLAMVATNVTYGYSDERLAQYKKDPASLIPPKG